MGNLIGNRCYTCNTELPNNIVLNKCFDCSMKNNTNYVNTNIFRKK